MRAPDRLGPHARTKAIGDVIGDLYRLVVILELNDGQDGPAQTGEVRRVAKFGGPGAIGAESSGEWGQSGI
jgi:hypothetical protein